MFGSLKVCEFITLNNRCPMWYHVRIVQEKHPQAFPSADFMATRKVQEEKIHLETVVHDRKILLKALILEFQYSFNICTYSWYCRLGPRLVALEWPWRLWGFVPSRSHNNAVGGGGLGGGGTRGRGEIKIVCFGHFGAIPASFSFAVFLSKPHN